MRKEAIGAIVLATIVSVCGCVPQTTGVRTTASEAPVAPLPPDTVAAMAVASEAFAGQILATGSASLIVVDHNQGNGTSNKDWLFGVDGNLGLQLDPVNVLFGANVLVGTRERASIRQDDPIVRTTTITVSGSGSAGFSEPG